MTLRLPQSDYDALQKLAAAQNRAISEVAREFIAQGLAGEIGKNNVDFIRRQIREELTAIMDSKMNRLISLLVKIGIPAMMLCDFVSRMLYLVYYRKDQRESFRRYYDQAKKNALGYMKSRDRDIEESLDSMLQGFKAMDEDPSGEAEKK
jgi:uncharacterized protein (DUF2164 family)